MRKVEPYGFSIAGSSPIPLTIAPIACSRIPNGTLRPTCVAANTPAPSNEVFVDSTRSAAPPIIVGVNGLSACMTVLPASRVATSPPGREHGERVAPALAGDAREVELTLGRDVGMRCGPRCDPRVPAAWAAAPRSATPAMCARTSSPTAKVASGSNPRTSLVARTSASPSGAPCDLEVPRAWGAGYAISVRSTISEGRDASSRGRRRRRRAARRDRSDRRRAGRASRRPRSGRPCPRGRS